MSAKVPLRTAETRAEKDLTDSRKLFYCPTCTRVYALPTGRRYICTRRNCRDIIGGMFHEASERPRSIPNAIDEIHSSDMHSMHEFRACEGPADKCKEYRWKTHYTKSEFVTKYKQVVLVELNG